MDHPVWEVYNLLRNASFNVKYWTRKLRPLERLDFLMGHVLLAAACASAVAGLVFLWEPTSGGGVVWQILAGVTALLAIGKPLFGLASKCSTLREIIVEYRTTESSLRELSNEITVAEEYSSTMRDMFKALLLQYDITQKKEPKAAEDDKLRDECYELVNRELPVASFYIPQIAVSEPPPAFGSRGGVQ